MSEPLDSRINIFFSYAQKDDRYRKELEKHLSLLRQQGLITSWHDRNIEAGKDWETEITKYLDSANIILLLISPDYMASEYCYSVEMKRALERHKTGEAQVIPIILRSVDLHGAPFSDLHMLPTDGKPVARWVNREDAFLDIIRGIRKTIEDINNRSSQVSTLSDLSLPTQTEPRAQTTQPPKTSPSPPMPSSSHANNPPQSSQPVQTAASSQTSQIPQSSPSSPTPSSSQNSNPSQPSQAGTSTQNPPSTPVTSALPSSQLPQVTSKEGAPDSMKATTDKAVRKLEEDKLGFTIWVKALRNFIVSPDTTTPLTIGIDGAWGTGKTSFMYMLQDLLEPSFSFWANLRKITWPWLKWFVPFIATLPIWTVGYLLVKIVKDSQSERPVWVQDLADGFTYDSEIDTDIDLSTLPSWKRFWAKIAGWHCPREPITNPTIWFNAWKFDQEEQLWAALALAVLGQIKKKYNIFQRFMFWIALEFKRFSWTIALYYIVIKFALPIILGVLAWKFDVFFKFAVGLYPKGNIKAFEAFFPLSQTLLMIGAGLSGIIQITSIIKDPFQIPIKRVFDKPDYNEKVGFIGSFEKDFSSIVSLITRRTLGRKPRKLIIFIDDLDRCKLPKAVDIIEGINLFLDSEQCVFVIGMDTTAVIASIETKYQDLFKQIQKERAGIVSAGRFFLDKIIQVPIHVPPSIETGIDNLVRGIIEHRVRPLQVQQAPVPTGSGRTTSDTLSQMAHTGGTTTAATSTQPLQLQQVNKASYSREEVRQAILVGARLLPENPRQVKRFINLFRLYVYIANEQEMFEEENQIGLTMDRLAIWVAWSIRWGELVRYLSEEVPLRLSESPLLAHLIQIAKSLETDGCWIRPSSGTNGATPVDPSQELIEFIHKTRAAEEKAVSHWSYLPWDLWFRDPDFLKCIKELESFWQHQQPSKINWLQTMLLMTRITFATNNVTASNGNAQITNP